VKPISNILAPPWAEQPIINSIVSSTAFTQNAEQQLTEMIRQNYNHPSIIFWSIANEPNSSTDINNLLQALNSVAHTQDPDRITTLADDTGTGDSIAQHTTTVGYNRYYGWYTGNYNDLAGFLSSAHQVLCIGVDKQLWANDEVFNVCVMVQCLCHKTHALNVKKASALAFLARV
jgi:glycosyl hydrolase family 2